MIASEIIFPAIWRACTMPIVPEFLAGRTPPDLYHAYLEPAFEPWAHALLDRLKPTGRILDLACGTGLLSRIVAARSEVTQIDAVDVAPPMIDKAQSLWSTAAGKTTFTIAGAEALPFEDAAFDCAVCQQGLQFFPDKLAALREVSRVLKPSGRAAFSTWCYAKDGNPVFESFEEIISRELGGDLVPFGPLSFGDRGEIARLAGEAGFTTISLEAETRISPLPDARTLVLFDLSFLGRPAADGTLQPILDFEDQANDAVIGAIIDQMEEQTARFRQADGSIHAPMRAHVLIVEK